VGLFGRIIESKERGIAADQVDKVAEEIRTGRFEAMNPKLLNWLEGLAWAAGAGAVTALQPSIVAGHLSTDFSWAAVASAALVGAGAYIRTHRLDGSDLPQANQDPKAPKP
jgi:hypothetical protein